MPRTFVTVWVTACLLAANAAAADNQLTSQEKQEGWILLFNGQDYTGWKCNNGKDVASAVDQGAMQPYKSGGYVIVHEKQFGDFILKCDIKMPEECNSGVFFRVENLNDPVNTGFEIQVATGKGTSCHDFGAIYDIVPLKQNASLGAGVWNALELKCQGPLVSVKLNGELVCEMNADEFSQPGKRAVAGDHKYELDGKKRAIKDFARQGYLGFQDHGHPVWYKNVKLLPLNTQQ
jgi:hypothetical protein